MAGHGVDDDPNLKGFARYFNGETNRGRANVRQFTSENPLFNPFLNGYFTPCSIYDEKLIAICFFFYSGLRPPMLASA